MKKPAMLITMLLLLCSVLLCSCGDNNKQTVGEKTSPTAPEKEQQPSEEPSGPIALAEDEIVRANEAFVPMITIDGVTEASEISCFFTSFYEKPEESI